MAGGGIIRGMLVIECPWCGARDQTEFAYFGEAHIVRPDNPSALSDEEWASYLFFRKNPKGTHHERWMHAAGCRQFFNITRHTVTGEILASYPPGSSPPPISAAAIGTAAAAATGGAKV